MPMEDEPRLSRDAGANEKWLRQLLSFKEEEARSVANPFYLPLPPDRKPLVVNLSPVERFLLWVPWTRKWLVKNSQRRLRAAVDLFVRSMHLSPEDQFHPPEDTATQGKR